MSVSKRESEAIIKMAIQSGVEACKTPETARAALVRAGLVDENDSPAPPYVNNAGCFKDCMLTNASKLLQLTNTDNVKEISGGGVMNTENLYHVVVVRKDEDHYLSEYVEDDEDSFVIEISTDNWWRSEDFFSCNMVRTFKVIN